MAYKVEILPGALQDIEDLFRWLSTDSPGTATKWFTGLQETFDKLEYMPARFPLAPESEIVGAEVRHCIYRRNYRVLFMISGQVVRIHHVRHSARQWMTEEEFES